eukprot:6202927-Pleurochrysis_carterae.AAC.2
METSPAAIEYIAGTSMAKCVLTQRTDRFLRSVGEASASGFAKRRRTASTPAVPRGKSGSMHSTCSRNSGGKLFKATRVATMSGIDAANAVDSTGTYCCCGLSDMWRWTWRKAGGEALDEREGMKGLATAENGS